MLFLDNILPCEIQFYQVFWFETFFFYNHVTYVSKSVYTSLQPCLLEGLVQISASSAVQLYKGLLKGWAALILEVIHQVQLIATGHHLSAPRR